MASGLRESGQPREENPDFAARADEPALARPSVIGSTLIMKGELTLDEGLIIEGTFEGTIVNRGNDKVIVRRVARLSGEISGHDLQIEDGTNLENAVLTGRIRLATGAT